ncbi:inositol monophosphatase [Priestia aryabhattai]|uniref:inositol monophosphatase family protein n=1 Tax=Bacillaceae TaxID=186817 RepID=UPI000BA0FD06|nr:MULTISPECIES: inositol monophosphatase family protein [Bacillaceae]MDT2047492.1 inositol monophosphatase family protein [Priestia flexa]OZT12390.1 inositol monophosphatase [Priestia aryabhattai]TDB55232.1 inositol monophosphatase family protein [Bacillus sp. CBEL-1]USY56387.1 inositol monophosphatase family protein [Bacillus sp. 1780r2a1]
MSDFWNQVDTYAKQWIKEAGNRIKASFSRELMIETKSNPNDLVTNMDKDIEQFFISKIKEVFPDHRILGEEGYGEKIETSEGVIWVIDPIDGTMNFVHQQRNFAISVGIFENGVGQAGFIYDVVHDELYHARKGKGAYINDQQLPPLKQVSIEESIVSLNATWVTENRRIDPSVLSPLVTRVRGTRSYGSAAIELAYVASGRLDAYITMRLAPWDFAAGKILIEELGGVVTDLKGKPLDILDRSSVFVAKPGLHEEILSTYLSKYKG